MDEGYWMLSYSDLTPALWDRLVLEFSHQAQKKKKKTKKPDSTHSDLKETLSSALTLSLLN